MKTFLKEWKTKEPKQKAFMLAGLASLALAVVGVFLPIVPQVPFAILAAYLFSKGSRRLHEWIRNNKWLGQPVRDWEDHRVLRPKLKVFSTLAMLGGAGFGHWKLSLGWAIALDVIFLASIAFVLTRKSKFPRKQSRR